MSFRTWSVALAVGLALQTPASAADKASGTVNVQKMGVITASNATAYVVRDSRHARTNQTEILLTDVAVDATELRSALDPHMAAINLDALNDRNYILLWVNAAGDVTMNATFSKTMTQFLNSTSDGLKVSWISHSAAHVEGRVYSSGPLRTMDGTSYTVDLRFAVDVPTPPTGQALLPGGGEAGRAFVAFVAAATKKNWAGIRAGSSPDALRMFDKSYNTPAENAENAADLVKAWIPTQKMKVAGGQLRGDVAILDVEGELFPGMMGLSLVKMVKTGAVWQFDRAARAGSIP